MNRLAVALPDLRTWEDICAIDELLPGLQLGQEAVALPFPGHLASRQSGLPGIQVAPSLRQLPLPLPYGQFRRGQPFLAAYQTLSSEAQV